MVASGTNRERKKAAGGAALLAFIALSLPGCLLEAQWHRHTILRELRTPRTAGPARLEVCDSIPVLHLYGAPSEIGRQHGTILKGALQALHRYLEIVVPAGMAKRLKADAQEFERVLPPEFREELAAMAQAADVPYETLLTLNVIPRVYCSGLATWGPASHKGRMVMGRNAEYFGFGLSDRGSLVVVYHPTRGNAVLSVSFIGMIGAFTGINEKGVAFGNMLVFNAKDDRIVRDGLSIQLLMRHAAQECGTARGMGEWLKARKQAIPINVILADPREALVLELGLTGSHTWEGKDGVVAVSNYFRGSGMYDSPVDCRRFRSLLNSAADDHGRFTAARMEKALHRARLKNLNLQAATFEPSLMRMRLSVNRVPASEGPYTVFDLKRLFAGENVTSAN